MPVLPMLALALGPTLLRIARARWLHATAFALTLVAGMALVGAGWWALQGRWASMNTMVTERELADGGRWLWFMLIAMGGLFMLSALVFRPHRGLQALLAGSAAFWILWGVWASPLLNDASSATGVMRRAGQIAGPDAQIGLVAWKEQNLLMADRKVANFGFKKPWEKQFTAAARWQAEAPGERWIFALADAVTPCVDSTRATVAGYANRRQWLMFRADAVVPGCVPKIAPTSDRWDSGQEPD